MSKTSFSDLTQGDADKAGEQIAEMDWELWRGFEEELFQRCSYKSRFDVHYLGNQKQPWEWMIQRCETWDEVERVLDWYKVEWKRDGRSKILTWNKLIFRCC